MVGGNIESAFYAVNAAITVTADVFHPLEQGNK